MSIIISAFNRPEMLRSALGSAQSQTYDALEFIIQDDSTNDECQEVVLEMSDPRVRYTHNVPPLGTSANLRAGYRKSLGRYFCTLNDDDLCAPNYIAVMIEAMEKNPSISLAFSDHFLINQEGDVLLTETEQNSRLWRRESLREGLIEPSIEIAILRKSIPCMFAVFRREAVDLEDFPDEVSGGYDYWLGYLGVRDGGSVYYSPQRLTYYRIHLESQTAGFADPLKRLQFSRYSQYIDRRFLSDPRLQSVHAPVRSRLAETHRVAGFALLRLSRRREAVREFAKSWEIRPAAGVLAGLLLCAAPQYFLNTVLKKQN